MIVTTTPNIEGKKIDKYLGIVTGTEIYLVGGLIGGGLANQERLYTFAVNNAMERMKEKAKALGADAIVGVSTNFTSPGNLNNMIVVVTGTAVLTDDIEKERQKRLQEQAERNKQAELEAANRAEEIRQLLEQNGGKDQLEVFLMQAERCEKFVDLKNLWNDYVWEGNPFYTEVENSINQKASTERLYGSKPAAVQALVDWIRSRIG